MSWLYLPAAVVDYSAAPCSDGVPCATSSANPTPLTSSKPVSATAGCTMPRCGMTLEHSTGDPGLDEWILSLGGSRASRSATPDSARPTTMNATAGLIPSESFATYDPNGACWRTSQLSFLSTTSTPFSGSWPRAAIGFDMTVYRRQPLAPLTRGIGSGLWPAIRSTDGERGGRGDLIQAVRGNPNSHYKLWPTPTVQDAKNNAGPSQWERNSYPLNVAVHIGPDMERVKGGGALNPDWVEWLMGWPVGWTDLKPLATDKYRLWLEQHG